MSNRRCVCVYISGWKCVPYVTQGILVALCARRLYKPATLKNVKMKELHVLYLYRIGLLCLPL
jgi:hypothetical protein